ncbi:efflux RND transporter periplasmic adaptor subunit [Falsirhodobacter deserti]|uniref:efflux RND transporter periplasmic adaptor subunit n=1 Tax=Falsirhodobacter deserti TaxID=1365611 RepID=UPI000FE2DAFF|nr:efflux RND transporter periplasmic adaptor subunit [Falsirhodobacter deserti]
MFRFAILCLFLGAAPLHAQEASLPALTVTEARREVLTDRVIVSGLVQPVQRVEVQPLIDGQPVEALEADVGDYVAAGQVLARLSTATLELQRARLQAQRAQAEAAAAQAEAGRVEADASAVEARANAERTSQLQARNATSQAAVDQARAGAATAEARVTAAAQQVAAAKADIRVVDAQLADLDLQLRRTDVTTPVAGRVITRNAAIGQIASPSAEPMFVLIRDGQLELRADVSETDLLRLAQGQPATLTLPDGSTLQGRVRLVEPQVDETTRLGRVRIAVDDSSRLRAGLFAQAEIAAAQRETMALPATAVGRDAEGSFVMTVTDGTVHRTPVTTGIREGGMVEIANGLSEGVQVVAKAGAFVREGDRINPVPAES